MPFENPDYSYGLADSLLNVLDYMLRVATDTEDGAALRRIADAREAVLDYKALIYPQVLQ